MKMEKGLVWLAYHQMLLVPMDNCGACLLSTGKKLSRKVIDGGYKGCGKISRCLTSQDLITSGHLKHTGKCRQVNLLLKKVSGYLVQKQIFSGPCKKNLASCHLLQKTWVI